MPIRWPEPFGLVMTEAMACGTPVIAFPEGSAPELVLDGRDRLRGRGRARDGECDPARLDEIDPRAAGAARRSASTSRLWPAAYERAYEVVAQSARSPIR